MPPPTSACALCGATWGDHWEEVEGKTLFFCCVVCAKEYGAILAEAKRLTGWDSVDTLELQGDYRGRVCKVSKGADSHRFMVSFFEDGDLRHAVGLD